MNNREFYVFREETELPDVVNEKMDAAFRQIQETSAERTSRIYHLRSRPYKQGVDGALLASKYRKRATGTLPAWKYEQGVTGVQPAWKYRRTAAAAACAALLAAGVITAAAAAYIYWGRGMSGALKASPEHQKELTEQGMAVVFSESSSTGAGSGTAEHHADGTGSIDRNADGTGGEGAATEQKIAPVTVNGVTIAPRTTVVTSDCVWVSFTVDGFALQEGADPGFDSVDFHGFGDDLSGRTSWFNACHSFYDGIVSDGSGHPLYEDGRSSDGSFVPRYTDENGTMEYVIQISADTDDSFLGRELHITFHDLGTLDRGTFHKLIEGSWDFTIPLSGSDAYRIFTAETAIGETGITVKKLEISPVSVRAVLSVPAGTDPEFIENLTYPCGLRFKDGTMLPVLSDGGGGSFTNDTKTEYRFLHPFEQIIDLEQVDALVLRNPDEAGKPQGENRYYIIPLK